MAKRIETILIDDIDQSAASSTIKFSIDNKLYEIDLNDKHTAAFHKALAPYVEKARKLNRRGKRPPA